MAGRKLKRTGERPAVFMAVIWLMLTACCWLTPCSGMDALTQAEMDEFSGRAGLAIGFEKSSTVNAVTTKATFNSLCFGDKDGWGGTMSYGDDNAGYLVLIGNGVNIGSISVNIPTGTKGTLNVGTTTSSTCYPKTGQSGFYIPKGKSFFTFTLTDVTIGLVDPDTINICLTNDPIDDSNAGTNINTEMEVVGLMWEEGVSINLNPKGDKLPQCYIWAH